MATYGIPTTPLECAQQMGHNYAFQYCIDGEYDLRFDDFTMKSILNGIKNKWIKCIQSKEFRTHNNDNYYEDLFLFKVTWFRVSPEEHRIDNAVIVTLHLELYILKDKVSADSMKECFHHLLRPKYEDCKEPCNPFWKSLDSLNVVGRQKYEKLIQGEGEVIL